MPIKLVNKNFKKLCSYYHKDINAHARNEFIFEAVLFNKSSCLALALDATYFINANAIKLVDKN
jgi:hypothetical protein